jgi:mannose-6-phosphate isomerase-like protein (cupin superfamily)
MEGWSTARLDGISTEHKPGFWDPWSKEPGYGDRWHSIRSHFGITAFGVNAYEAEAGEELVVAHDETDFGGQEELYYVVRGRASFVLGDEEVELGEGELLYVAPEVVRQADALEAGTLVFMVGGPPGKPYEPWDFE